MFWAIWSSCIKYCHNLSKICFVTFQNNLWENISRTFKNILKTFHEIFRHLKHFPKTLSKGCRKLLCNFLGKVSKIFQEIFLNVYCTDLWTFQKLFPKYFCQVSNLSWKLLKTLQKYFVLCELIFTEIQFFGLFVNVTVTAFTKIIFIVSTFVTVQIRKILRPNPLMCS